MDKEKAPEAERKVLTARQSFTNMMVGLVMVLFISITGLMSLHFREPGLAAAFLLVGLIFAWATGLEWKKYRAVRGGAMIFLQRASSSPQAPPKEQVIIILWLTLTAAAFSGMLLWLWSVYPSAMPLSGWVMMVILNLASWIYVVFCLRRSVANMHRSASNQLSEHDGEAERNVWPPPPMRPNDPQS